MTELIKMGILYIILFSTFIYANNYHTKILNFLSNSKKQYIEYMEDSSLGVGL